MNEKQIAVKILEDISTIKADMENLVKLIKSFTSHILQLVKDKAGILPDETSFLKVVAQLITIGVVNVYVPKTYRGIIKLLGVPYKVLKLLDKYVLDKFLGTNWYNKLRAKVGI